MNYKIVNQYGLKDGDIFRSPLKALKNCAKREGEGWKVIEVETGKIIQRHPELKNEWVYL